MAKHTLGSYLRAARKRKKLSAVEVAHRVGISSPVLILSWERNHGQALPLHTLKKLVPLYDLDVEIVFDLILHFQVTRLEKKFNKLIGEEK